MGERSYLPALGRFLQPDPVVNGGANPYALAAGDPVNGHDPSGTRDSFWSSLIGIAAAAIVGAALGAATAGIGASTVLGAIAFIGAEMAVGAVTAAVGAAVTQAVSVGSVDWAQVGVAAAIGAAVSGAFGVVGRFARNRGSWESPEPDSGIRTVRRTPPPSSPAPLTGPEIAAIKPMFPDTPGWYLASTQKDIQGFFRFNRTTPFDLMENMGRRQLRMPTIPE
jgi:uncharacterized protein RhaS with RHS repeats